MSGEESLPVRFGAYTIRALLGEGGMGRVYLAEHPNTRRAVALKVLRPGRMGEEFRRRFERETYVLGRLRHRGIAAIYEAGSFETDAGEQPHIAMEHVEGVPLTEHVRRNDLDLRGRLALLAEVCDAVHAAHEAGVVHRDIKPANILVDADGHPKVLDFGLARLLDPSESLRTETGQILGTIRYMSPEHLSGDPRLVDEVSDVYSLGVLAWETLTGGLPYDLEEKSLPEAARLIREEEPASLGSLCRELRGDVETIIGKALRKEKSRRYPAAAALAEDLRRHLRSEPIVARPPSAWYYLGKFARRHRILVGAAAAIFLLILAGFVLVGDARRRASRAEGDAGEARRESLDLLFETTDLSRNRGYWERTLAASEEALRRIEAGAPGDHPDEVGLRLRAAEAHIALNQPEDAEADLAHLEGRPLRPEQEARRLLWQAELARADGRPDAESRYRAAIGAGLPPADDAYVRALVAETMPEAVDRLEDALALGGTRPDAEDLERRSREALRELAGR